MPSPERVEAVRRMSPQEDWDEFRSILDAGWEALMSLPPEERERQLELMRQEHQAGNDAIVEALRRSERTF